MPDNKIQTDPRCIAGSLFLFLLLLVMPVSAVDYPPSFYFNRTCTDDWTVHYSALITTYNCNQTECFEDISFDKTCSDGCSHTLNDCRADNFTQGLILLSFIAFTAILIYFSPQMGPLGYLVNGLIIISGLGLSAVMDVFAWARWFFILYTLAAAVFILFRGSSDENEEGGED